MSFKAKILEMRLLYAFLCMFVANESFYPFIDGEYTLYIGIFLVQLTLLNCPALYMPSGIPLFLHSERAFTQNNLLCSNTIAWGFGGY